MEPPAPRVASLFLVPPTLVGVGILLFIALLNRRRDLVLVSLLVLTVALGAKLWARRGAAGVAPRLLVDRRRLFPGEVVTLTAGLQNRGCLPVALHLTLPVDGLGGTPALSREGGLLWYQEAEFRWPIPAPRRGVHRVGPLHATVGDPFGFFASGLTGGEALEILVYPRIHPLPRVALPRRDFFGVPGAESAVRDPVYILGTRDYQPGAPAKHIHWKASARHDRLQEKLFEPTEQEKVLLALDVDGYARQGAGAEFERAVEAVASLAARLDRDGCAVGLLTNGAGGGQAGGLPIRRTADQLAAILERLARLRMVSGAALQDVARDALQLPWGVSALCVALEPGAATEAIQGYFARRHVPVAFFVSRPAAAPGASGRGPGGVRLLRSLLREGRP
ncbi:MAG: DUF58 domain-containing protein [Candidatus Methylomirabilales bacterium]